MLFISLFVFFIILSGKVTAEICIFSGAVSALGVLFACKVLGWSREKSLACLRHIPDGLIYIPIVFFMIIKSNFQVMALILSPKRKIQPQLFSFRSGLNRDLSRVVLANSITITPGTLTAELEGDRLLVHALDRPFKFEELEFVFQRQLLKFEAGEAKTHV